MIERVLLFHDDGTVEEYRMRMDAPPPLAPPAPPKRSKKRKSPRRRCQLCEKLIDREKWDDHQSRHLSGNPAPVTGTFEDFTTRPWEEIEREAAQALDEPEEVM